MSDYCGTFQAKTEAMARRVDRLMFQFLRDKENGGSYIDSKDKTMVRIESVVCDEDEFEHLLLDLVPFLTRGQAALHVQVTDEWDIDVISYRFDPDSGTWLYQEAVIIHRAENLLDESEIRFLKDLLVSCKEDKARRIARKILEGPPEYPVVP